MKKQTILGVLLLLVMFCFNAKSEVITVDGASEIANTFFSQSARSQKSQLKSIAQLEYAWDSNSLTASGNTMLKSVEEDPTFYVFNNPDGEGFVIVSGDDNARQVIGYSYESKIPAANEIPDPMKDYLLGIDSEIKWARANLTSTNKNLKATEAETGGTVLKYCETPTWGQNAPFNNLTPKVMVEDSKGSFTVDKKFYNEDTKTVETTTIKASEVSAKTGCVPTAFASVMRYHKWPLQGKGTISGSYTYDLYNQDGYRTDIRTETIEHSATTYNWDNMPMSYSSSWTEENKTQVATLMRNLGYAFGVQYSSGSTNYTETNYLPTIITDRFDYTYETVLYGQSGVSDGAITDTDTWITKLKGSLDNDCPIPYGAKNFGTGDSRHMFVIDGYTDNNYFHFNFGWTGNANGWFLITAVTPSTGDNYSWQTESKHRAYINFKPNKIVTVSVVADPATAGSVTIDGASVTSKEIQYGSSVTLQATGDNFYGWLVDGEVVSTDATYIFTANETATYTAKFATHVTLTLNNVLMENGSPSFDVVNTSSASVTNVVEGVNTILTANTQRGYTFLGWYKSDGETLISASNPYTLNITSEIVEEPIIFAQFSQLSPITATSFATSADASMGTVSCKFNDQLVSEVYAGEQITLTASPKSGYMFTGWSVDGVTISTSKEYTVTVEEGKTYTANFALSGADYIVSPSTGTYTDLRSGYATAWTYTTTGTNPVELQLTATNGATPIKAIGNTGKYYPSGWDVNATQTYTPITFTLSVPEGQKITRYEITYTVSGDVTISNGQTTTSEAKTLIWTATEDVQSTSFTLSGTSGGYIEVTNFVVSVLSTGGGEVTPTQYTVTVSTNGTGGTATVKKGQATSAETESESVTVGAGEYVTFAATPNSGYEFLNWTKDGTEISTEIPFSVPVNANITLTANFRQTEQGGGEGEEELEYCEPTQNMTNLNHKNGNPNRKLNSFTISDGTANVVVSDIQTSYTDKVYKNRTESVLTTKPGATLSFTELSLDNAAWMHAYVYIDYNNDGTFNTEKNNNGTVKNKEVYGELVSYSAYSATSDASGFTNINGVPTPDIDGSGNNSREGDGGNGVSTSTIPAWTIPTDLAEGEYRLRFKIDWNSIDPCGNTSTNNAIEKNNGSICDITLKVIKTYTVTVATSPTDGGTATVNNEQSVTVVSGTEVVFNTTANTGYNFLGWYNGEDLVTKDKLYYETITSDLSLTAKFEKQQVEVSVSAGNGGSVSIAQGTNSLTSPTTVEYGTEVIFTATPRAGYRFESWSDASTANPYTVTITEPKSLTATFEALQSFTVKVTTNGTGGTASATSNSVYENGQVTLTAEAADSYRFTGWYQNGELVTMANPYTISSVSADINYEAKFEESSDELLLTFACLSDLHAQQDLISDANNLQLRESVTKTLNKIKTQENVDLIVLGGDYTSNTYITEESWQTTRDLLTTATRGAFNGTKTPVIYVNGNHDYEVAYTNVANGDGIPKNYNAGEYYGTPMKTDIGALAEADCFYETATNGTGEAFSLLAAYHYVVNGFDFVVLNAGKNLFASATTYTYTTESVQWCANKLAEIYATDKNKTVFFLVHIPFEDSNSLNSGKGMKSDDAGTTLLKSTLAQYPNLIMLYGHDHGGDSAYIREATSQRVTEYATNGDVLTQGESEPVYYIQNYNTSEYLGYSGRNISNTATQTSDVTITTSTYNGVEGAFNIYMNNAPNDDQNNPINYLHCGGSGRFSGNATNTALGQQVYLYEVEDPTAATIRATRVTEIESGATYMLVAYSEKASGYYALTNEMYNNDGTKEQRMVGASVTITDETITYEQTTSSVLWNIVEKPSATDKSFFSSFMGSMRYYANTIEGTDQLAERQIVQALMVYVYSDRVELKMKNYAQSGTINGITVNQDLTPYVSYRTVTHSAEAVTATPVITSTGGDVDASTEVTVTIDAPEWHNLYYTINGENPTEASTKVENGQITFTADAEVEEYVVKVVAQEGIRLVSNVATVTYSVVDTHGITVSATEGGTASFAIEGENVILTASDPKEGYYFTGWSVGESAEIVSTANPYTTAIVENAAYKANYAKCTYTVTLTAGEGGTVKIGEDDAQSTLTETIAHGESITIEATANTGYRFVNWTIDGETGATQNPFTFEVTEDYEIIANFEEIPDVQYFDVVVIAGTGGSATASSNSVEENTIVTLTATPESGYTFRNWTVAGEEVSTENPYKPTITVDTKYVAHFVPENANTLPTGYCSVTQRMNEGCSTDARTDVHSHSLQGLTAKYNNQEVLSLPATTSTFNDLTGSKSFTVVQGGTIEISFTNGRWSKNVWFGFDWDRDGDWEKVFAAYPESGRVGGNEDAGNITISVPNDAVVGKSVMRIVSDGVDCEANWSEATPMCGTHGTGIIGYAGSLHDVTLYVEEGYVSDVIYNVSVSSEDAAKGTAEASANTVPERWTITLEATPADGYYFTGWSAKGDATILSTANPYKPVITQDMEFVAHFESLPVYTVTATSDKEQGIVSPASSQVMSGKTVTLTATPLPRYQFVNWTKDGEVVSTNATYTTSAITGEVEYVANFELVTEELPVSTATTNFATYQTNSIDKIKDSSYSTKFWSDGGQDVGKYIMVDLGAEYDIVAIKLHFMGTSDIPVGADVQISLNNSDDWETVSSFGASGTYEQRSEGTNTISCHSCSFEPKSARYVRMIITQQTGNWLQMAEFEVYVAGEVRSVVKVAKSTATSDATVVVKTDAPATITVGTQTYNTTEENLTVEVPISGTEETAIESVGGCIVSVDCNDNSYPTTLPISATELVLRNTSASEVEIDAPLLAKITVVSDANDKAATVSPTSDLSQGVQVVVEKEIYTPKTLADGTTPTIFNFLSMPFAFNTADIKYWDGSSWETAEPETHVRILLYNSDTRAAQDYKNTWRTLRATESETVAANQGFVIVGNNDLGTTVKLQFTSAVAAYNGSVTSVTANRYRKDEGETHIQDQDWNFNGVPYLTAGEFAGDYTLYTYDNSTLSYVSHTPVQGLTLKPYQAVMYQAEIEGTDLTKDIAINTASISKANASENVYARAYISIDDATPAKIILCDETSENFVVNEDAWYMPSLINTTPAAYFNIEGAEASVSVQPSANELPMTVYTGAGTAHRISLASTDGNYNVYLKDAATDEVVCLNDEDYTFTATAKTTISDRFTVSMVEPTGITESVADATIKAVATAEGIKLFGTEQGQEVALYTANGMLITNQVTEDSVTTIPTSVTGVIIVKVADETVKVVK